MAVNASVRRFGLEPFWRHASTVNSSPAPSAGRIITRIPTTSRSERGTNASAWSAGSPARQKRSHITAPPTT